jgi:uncharacterized membrane protein
MPWLGITAGTITGAQAGKLSDYGISDRFVKEVGSTIRPGNSVLFLMVSSMTEDRIIDVLSRHKAILLRTNLSKEDETASRRFRAAEVM